jgi:hypothetical protein
MGVRTPATGLWCLLAAALEAETVPARAETPDWNDVTIVPSDLADGRREAVVADIFINEVEDGLLAFR